MTVNLTTLGDGLLGWLYQADEERDTQALQSRVSNACLKTYEDLSEATVVLLDLSDAFKSEGFSDESEPLKLIAEQIDVIGKAAIPSKEDATDGIAESAERQIVQIQRDWARVEAEANVEEEQDPELRVARKRSLEDLEETHRAMLMDAYDSLNDIKRQEAGEEPAFAPAARKISKCTFMYRQKVTHSPVVKAPTATEE